MKESGKSYSFIGYMLTFGKSRGGTGIYNENGKFINQSLYQKGQSIDHFRSKKDSNEKFTRFCVKSCTLTYDDGIEMIVKHHKAAVKKD